ncbi:hypothetical protein [Chryseobacterium hagamense]|nr:hypothetical protein [Chryseobacterium hagamense]
MQKSPERFHGIISGDPIANYIFFFRHPYDIDDFVSDINLALAGRFSDIEDQDYSSGLGSYWFAEITPTYFELWQEGHAKKLIPLEDWKKILLSWKECVE